MDLQAALTSIRAANLSLRVVSHNIANANTPGYHRQEVRLADTTPVTVNSFQLGYGVRVQQVRAFRDAYLEEGLVQNRSEKAAVDARLDTLKQVEAILATGDGSVHDRINKLFQAANTLHERPTDATARQLFLESADAWAASVKGTSAEFDRLKGDLRQQLSTVLTEINQTTGNLAQIHRLLHETESGGQVANDTNSERDRLVGELAELIDVSYLRTPVEGQAIVLGGDSVLVGVDPPVLELRTRADGSVYVGEQGWSDDVQIAGGKLAGLIEAYNSVINGYQKDLQDLSAQVAAAFNGIQSQGIAPSRPLTQTSATLDVADPADLLQSLNGFGPIQAGALTVTLTNQATGERVNHVVNINPATQSLNDLANALSAIPNVTSFVNTVSGRLQILTSTGYSLDFGGQLPSKPDTTAITGTSAVTLAGQYTGKTNDTFTFTAIDSGNVANGNNLRLEVRNSAGNLVTTVDVGKDYEAGKPKNVVNGLQIKLSGGSINTGDTFTVRLAPQPDTSGVVNALGVNSLFVGNDISNLEVNPEIVKDPNRLATAQSYATGDSSNSARFRALASQATFGKQQNQTIAQAFADLSATAGQETATAHEFTTQLARIQDTLRARWEGYSAVDPEEEAVKLLQFQRQFQASSQYISVVNSTFNDLLNFFR